MEFLKYRRHASSLLVVALFSLPAWSGNSKKSSGSGAQIVDAGSFSVYVNGKRVANEKFEITQSPDASVAKAELKLEDSKNAQMAELHMSPNGDLQRYQWSEKDQGQAVVEPKDEFLIEKVTLNQGKSAEQPFILPPSTQILDDYFFSQRQLLLWRYLATQCAPKAGEKGCNLSPTQFGVIVPRAQSSSQVTVEYAGQQKVLIKGSDKELNRFELHMEGNDWTVWVDEAYKIQKIAIDSEHTEVFRD